MWKEPGRENLRPLLSSTVVIGVAARATAYGVTGDLELAEDAASEAFYAALDGLQDLRDTQRFGPWLRTVEELLRRLVGVVAPKVTVRFLTYKRPRYRAALHMQLGDNLIPAAIGGVLNSWPGLSDGVSAASVLIYLEPWATAQSGQVVELADFSLFDFLENTRQ